MAYDTTKLLQDLKRHEGEIVISGRHVPYQDSLGEWTAGYGRLLARGFSQDEAELMLKNDIDEVYKHAVTLSYWNFLNDPRKDVILNMLFNLGQTRFHRFRRMETALGMAAFHKASEEMLDSRWARQVKGRAVELSEQMRTGEYVQP